MEDKMKNIIFTSALLLVSTLSMAVITPSGFDTNKCTKCHSANPQDGVNQFPRLEGQSVAYFTNAMAAYKSKSRHSYDAVALMSKRVNLDAATIAQLGDFFNKLPTIPGIAGDAEKIAAGKVIYQEGIPDRDVMNCVMCHGKNAEGKGKSPRLAGQYKDFLVQQMHAYRDGDINDQEDMKELGKTLTEAEIENVSLYLQSLN
jgi:cytochrome c553